MEPRIETDASSSPARAPGNLPLPRTVLYVEDEPLNTLIMQEVFRMLPGIELTLAGTAEEGLACIRDRCPDLVLVDMHLPDMNGLELVRRLREDPRTRTLRLVMLSANAMEADVHRAMAAGVDEYWTKPVRPSRLLQDLARVLDGA